MKMAEMLLLKRKIVKPGLFHQNCTSSQDKQGYYGRERVRNKITIRLKVLYSHKYNCFNHYRVVIPLHDVKLLNCCEFLKSWKYKTSISDLLG